jgi:hypothetical protein
MVELQAMVLLIVKRWVDDAFLWQERPPRLTPSAEMTFSERQGYAINGMSN